MDGTGLQIAVDPIPRAARSVVRTAIRRRAAALGQGTVRLLTASINVTQLL